MLFTTSICILNTFVPRNGYVNNAEQRKFPTVKVKYIVNNSVITSVYVPSCAITMFRLIYKMLASWYELPNLQKSHAMTSFEIFERGTFYGAKIS